MRFLRILLVGSFVLAVSSSAAKSPAADNTARADFDKVYAKYKDITKQLFDLRDRYPVAKEADRPAMEQKYNDLLKEGNELRPKVLAAAEKAFVENPKDAMLAGMLMTVVENMLTTDDDEEAWRLVGVLIEHKLSNPGLANLAGAAAYFTGNYDDAEKYLKQAKDAKTLNPRGEEALASIPKYREKWARELKFREADAKSDLPRVKLTIGDAKGNVKGDIIVELFENEAPNTTANFLSLAEKKKYDNVVFHRVLNEFMAQTGDPEGTGRGGPGYTIPDEFDKKDHREHFRGSLSMASTGLPNSAGSQFFICFGPKESLDGHYTVFGRVIEGLDLLAKIQRTHVVDKQTHEEKPIPGVSPDKIVRAEILPSKKEHSHTPKTLPEKK